MKKLTFGVKNINGSHQKLVVCHETKQYEIGQVCANSTFIDVWVKQKDLNTIKTYLESVGYTRTDKEFGKENE